MDGPEGSSFFWAMTDFCEGQHVAPKIRPLNFSAAPINHPFNPELFMMSFDPSVVSGTFMTRLVYKNTDVLSFDYKYSSLYPNGLDESLEVILDAKSNNLFSTIKLKQGEGFITYRDKNGILWKQSSIN